MCQSIAQCITQKKLSANIKRKRKAFIAHSPKACDIDESASPKRYLKRVTQVRRQRRIDCLRVSTPSETETRARRLCAVYEQLEMEFAPHNSLHSHNDHAV